MKYKYNQTLPTKADKY